MQISNIFDQAKQIMKVDQSTTEDDRLERTAHAVMMTCAMIQAYATQQLVNAIDRNTEKNDS